MLAIARLAGGGLASFEATRFATGNQNKNGLEVNGQKGAVRFNFERMNELEFYDATEPRQTQGWRTLMVTHAGDHPYAEAWWPDAHCIGYEHTFTNMAYDILLDLAGPSYRRKLIALLADFQQAYQNQRVLAAMAASAAAKAPVKLSKVQ